MSRFLALPFLLTAVMLSGCLPQPEPAVPPVTSTELSNALAKVEQNINDTVHNQCGQWPDAQQTQLEQLKSVQAMQLQLEQKLDSIQHKMDTPPPAPPVVQKTKTAQCPPLSSVTKVNNKMIVGQVEWLWIEAVNKVYEARVDTGATTSSISATQITPFEKDGKSWVKFQLAPDDSEILYEIEAPLVRYARIKQASADGHDRRPVASLTVRLGNMTEVAEFTLTDRTDMSYPILLGREFLQDVAIVDVARKKVQPKPEIMPGQPKVKEVSKPKS